MACFGFDCGTYNLVCCKRDENKEFDYTSGINAFLEIATEDRYVFNMMDSVNVPLVELDDVAYALGESAVRTAYTLSNLELKRPMVAGCVNPKESSAFEIMKIMMHDLIETKDDKNLLYYSVPANAVNQETDADYHGRILQAIFDAYESEEGFKVDAHPINEGLALVYAELEKKMFSGISVSCGAGMVNLCFALYGNPVFKFSLVNSGDWIDKMAAKATGESIAYINKRKHQIDLSKPPTDLIDRAIQTQYQLMIEKTVHGIKKGFSEMETKVRIDDDIDVVISGGTSSPFGFHTLFKEALTMAKLPIKIGNVIKPKEPLKSVARGCLLAAEAAAKG